MRGEHTAHGRRAGALAAVRSPGSGCRCDCPGALINRLTFSAFNALYYRRAAHGNEVGAPCPASSFFFPLDGIERLEPALWPPGFLQYQCVVPEAGRRGDPRDPGAGQRLSRGAGLGVLKRFGDRRSPGLLSFPRPGLTLAVDLAFRGELTLALLEELDAVVGEAGGAVYPAKDARMSRRELPGLLSGLGEHSPGHDGPPVLLLFLAACRRGADRRPAGADRRRHLRHRRGGRQAYAGRRREPLSPGRNPARLAAVGDDLRVRGARRSETAVLDVLDLDRHAAVVKAGVLDAGHSTWRWWRTATLPDQGGARWSP